MRYTSEHKENTRARLLEMGGALAKKDGFGATGVDGIMAAVGLTSGSFYSHFRSKAELLEAIVESELTRSLKLFEGKTGKELGAVLESYLSLHHVNRPASGCAAPALGAEVARSGEAPRQIFERFTLQIMAAIRLQVIDENTAWVIISQAVGAVTLARAMASEPARVAILEAVLQDCRGKLAAAAVSHD